MGLEVKNTESIEKCRVAIIGAGNAAREHIRAFSDIAGVSIAGIHSRTASKAKALAIEYDIPLVCNSVAELYEKTKAELVVAAVDVLSSLSVSIACFKYPWTVLLEKPAGYNIAEAKLIKGAANKRKRNVFVALNRRFYSSTQAVKKELVGEDNRFIRVQDQQDQKAARTLGHPAEVVENWMYANSVHLIDYFRIFGRGKITGVEPVIPWQANNPSIVVAKIIFDSGDTGIYEGIWSGPGPWAVSVSTPGGYWELKPLEQVAFQKKGERVLTPEEQHVWDKKFKPGFRLQARHAVAASLGKESDLVSLDDAFETMLLIRDIFSNRKKNRRFF